MNISKKLLFSNMIITIITMIILSLIINNIVTNYITNNIKKNLINTSEYHSELFKVDILIDKNVNIKSNKLSLNKRFKVNSGINFIILDLNNIKNIVDFKITNKDFKINKDIISTLVSMNKENVYSFHFNNIKYLGYNNEIYIEKNGKEMNFIMISFISDELAHSIKRDIMNVIFILIIILCIALIILANYISKFIIKPINVLVEVTENISQKNFDEKVNLKTKDEFQLLGCAINKMSANLKKKDIEQRKFYENISHELKTPITVISSYAEGLKSNLFVEEDEVLDIIVEECYKVKNQLESIIYLSKLDTINNFYDFKKVSLNKIISNSLNKVESMLILNEIDVVYDLKKDIYITADEEKLNRVFSNILTNCIKYTKDTIFIDIIIDSMLVKVNISDNGSGFKKEIIENPFSGTIIGDKEGNGVGLTLIKRIIDDHGWKIEIKNKENFGAIYLLEIKL